MAVLVVVHSSPDNPGGLAAVLNRGSTYPVTYARDGVRIPYGHVYVAPPDFHLTTAGGRRRVRYGPQTEPAAWPSEEDALVPHMPASAANAVAVDHVIPASQMAAVIAGLVGKPHRVSRQRKDGLPRARAPARQRARAAKRAAGRE